MSTTKPKTISLADRAVYQQALQRNGVPAIYAFMAAQALTSPYRTKELANIGAASLLYGGFIWDRAPPGQDFWATIVNYELP